MHVAILETVASSTLWNVRLWLTHTSAEETLDVLREGPFPPLPRPHADPECQLPARWYGLIISGSLNLSGQCGANSRSNCKNEPYCHEPNSQNNKRAICLGSTTLEHSQLTSSSKQGDFTVPGVKSITSKVRSRSALVTGRGRLFPNSKEGLEGGKVDDEDKVAAA